VWNSNPRSRLPSEQKQYMPQTARLPWPATIYLHVNLTQVHLFQHKVQQCGHEDEALLLNVATLPSGDLHSHSWRWRREMMNGCGAILEWYTPEKDVTSLIQRKLQEAWPFASNIRSITCIIRECEAFIYVHSDYGNETYFEGYRNDVCMSPRTYTNYIQV
jgi:hypothetical protein